MIFETLVVLDHISLMQYLLNITAVFDRSHLLYTMEWLLLPKQTIII